MTRTDVRGRMTARCRGGPRGVGAPATPVRAMTRHLHDLDFLTSVALLGSAAVAAATGIIADLWDLNDFWYHTVSGYVAAGLGVLHVVLNRQRLTGYARFRWRSLRSSTPATAPAPTQRGSALASSPSPPSLARVALSRRGLLGLGIGAAAGWLLGRGLREPPALDVGSDVGVDLPPVEQAGDPRCARDGHRLGSLVSSSTRRSRRTPDRPADRRHRWRGLPTGDAIRTRRSVRAFAPDRPMSLDELSRVLFLTAGISADLQGNARRAAPSSGALYPIEVYAVVHRVDGIPAGVYHYAVREHALELVRPGDHRAAVVDQAIAQEFLGECGVVLFLTMIMQRMRPKYQDRSYRYGLLEAGHLGENAYLAATSLGLGACGVGAFMDDAINTMLGVDGVDEAAVYMLAVGHRRDVA